MGTKRLGLVCCLSVMYRVLMTEIAIAHWKSLRHNIYFKVSHYAIAQVIRTDSGRYSTWPMVLREVSSTWTIFLSPSTSATVTGCSFG